MSNIDRLERLEASLTKSVAGFLSDLRITGKTRQKDSEMTDPNDSASPQIKTEWPNSNFHNTHSAGGLTKRELFAIKALQGLATGYEVDGIDHERLAKDSVSCADALIAELNKETP